MKKRLLSMLLILCLVTALFSGFSVTASADNETIQHTLKGGETVIGVCKSLGIDFYANYKWITETNKITNYGNLKVGTVLTLPKPGTTPSVVPGGTPAVKPGTPAPNPGGAVVPGGGSGLKLIGNDFVSGYFITHIMQSGETVSGVCNSLGINFTENASIIQQVNNIKDYRRIFAGRAILLPVPQPPASGPAVAIVGHRVVSGDAMYNICNSYGIDYASNLERLQRLNNRNDSFARITPGQVIYLPVSYVAAPSGGGGAVTPGGNGGGDSGVKPVDPNKPVNPDKPGDGGNAKPGDLSSGGILADGKIHKISAKNTNQFRGSYEVTVGGEEVKEAKSGSVVKLTASPKRDYQLGNISITDKDGNTVAELKNDQFVMPNCDIIIRVDFVSKTEYTITKAEAKNGQFTVETNGSAADKAAADMIVTVTPDPDFGFEPGKIIVKTSGGKTISVKADGSFKMPKDSITVSVSFEAAKPHTIEKRIPLFAKGNGDFAFKVDGKVVTAAECGRTVQIITTPADGYRVDDITVTKADGNDVKVTNSSFVMPETDVTVKVKFTAKTPEVTVLTYGAGDAAITVDGVNVKNVIAGKTVTVVDEPKPTEADASKSVYELDKVEVYNQVSGLAVAYDAASKSFTMPNDDVEVRVFFKLKNLEVYGVRGGNGIFELSCAATNSKAVMDQKPNVEKLGVTAKYGDTVQVTPKPNKGFGVESIKVYDTMGGEEVAKVDANNCFVMPEYEKVYVEVIFTGNNVCAITDGHGTYTINGMEGPTTAGKPGQICVQAVKNTKVELELKPGKGYELDEITVTDTKTLKKEIKVSVNGDKASFTMPEEDVLIDVSFKPIMYKINVAPAEYGKVEIQRAGKAIDSCNAGPTVEILCSPDVDAKVASVTVTDSEGKPVATTEVTKGEKYSFAMPLSEVKVEVVFVTTTEYNIDVTTSGHGSFALKNGDADITAAHKLSGGLTCSIETTPAIFYEIDKITVNGEAIKLNGRYGPHDFVMPNKDVEVVINYVPSDDNLCARREANGTYTINGDAGPKNPGEAGQILKKYKAGETISIVTTPQPGYELDKVTVKNFTGTADLAAVTIDGNNASFKMPSEPAVLDVSFKLTMFDIKLNPVSDGRAAIVNAADEAITSSNAGPKVFIVTAPDAGAVVESVTVTDSEGKPVAVNADTLNAKYSFSMPLSAVTVDVKFVSSTVYNINLKTPVHGEVKIYDPNGADITSAAKLAGGQAGTFETKPEIGYELDRITVNGTDIEVNGKYGSHSFVMPHMDADVEVVFRPTGQNLFARIDAKGPNGSYTINGENGPAASGIAKEIFIPMDKNKDVKIVAAPQAGYELDKVTVTDVAGKELVKPSVNGNNISFKMPEGTAIVTVSFKLSMFDIKLAPATNGRFTVLNTSSKPITVSNAGPKITVSCQPDGGAEVSKVTVTDSEGKSVAVTKLSDVKYEFTMPASAVSVKVEFASATKYAVNVTSPSSCKTVVLGPDNKPAASIAGGMTGTINTTPDAGTEIKSITVNGVAVTLNGRYGPHSFVMPYADAAIVVTMK